MRGGCERQAFLLAREMRHRCGLNAHVWALFGAEWYPGDYQGQFEAAGIPTKVLGFGMPRYSWVQRCLPIVRELKHSGVDVLLPFTTWPNVVAGLTYRFAGVKLCIWGERHAGGERVPGVERVAVKQYRRFVANSSAGVEFLVQEMRVPRQRVSFVPNGVEPPGINLASDWRTRLGVRQGQKLVVKIANLTGYKDHSALLRAWIALQDAWTEPHRPCLALAGHQADTEIFNECQRIVRDGGIESTVRFLGSITDVPSLIHASDLAVFSSPKEGMPNGVLECMAGGKAVVASDLPGVRDALGSDAETLVSPGDAPGFTRKLLWLLRDDGKCQALGLRNHLRIREEFSVSRMVDRYLKVVELELSQTFGGPASGAVQASEKAA